LLLSSFKRKKLTKKHKDDSILLEQIKQGDEKTYALLVDLHYNNLCIYANSLTKDLLLAEDIVQNVFINIWNRRKHLSIKSSIKSMLYRSTYNEFIDQYRKKNASLKVEETYCHHLNTIVNDYDEELIKETIKLVYNIVENLPVKCREVFLLSKKNGLTNSEIADYLNTSIKNVESHISKAFKVIRKNLDSKSINIFFFLYRLNGKWPY